jgi:hypothetical protein
MAGDGAAEVAELVDALGRQLGPDPEDADEPDRDQGRGRGRARGGAVGGFESLAPAGGYGRPVAATLAVAAQLLGASPQRVQKAAQAVEPYVHANGSPRWSLMLLERALGQAPPKARRGTTGQGTPWRHENRNSYQRTHRPDRRGQGGAAASPPDPSD